MRAALGRPRPPAPAGTPPVRPCSRPAARSTRRSRPCRPRRDTSRRSPPAAGPPSHAPGAVGVGQRHRDPPEQHRHRLEPQPRRAWKIADFDGNLIGSSHRAPTTDRRVNNAKHVLIRALASATPSRSRNTPSTRAGNDRCRCSVRPALGDHLIDQRRRERPRQHPHRHQIRQAAAPTPASPIQHEAPPQTTPL